MDEDMEQPICTEVTCHASTGGKIQLVKFELSADYGFSFSRKYQVPDGWDESQIAEFQRNKTQALRNEIERLAQSEYDSLVEQKRELNAGS